MKKEIEKIDTKNKEEILNKIIEYKDLYDFAEIVPLSALKNRNVNEYEKLIVFFQFLFCLSFYKQNCFLFYFS